MAGVTNAHAQSSDALIDKLVEKGILTTKEAKDLREEADKDFKTALSSKNGMPDWVSSFKINGDFRGRFEQNSSENYQYAERDRFRYRLRVGAIAALGEQFDVGMRIASGNPYSTFGGLPITANQDLGKLSSRKFLWLDAAYAKWSPISTGDFNAAITIGKFDNPFQLSNMVYDYDIVPEGAVLQTSYKVSEHHSIRGIGAFFVLDELNQGVGAIPSLGGTSDPYMYGGQLLFESKWTEKIESSLGIAAFNVANKEAISSKIQALYSVGTTREPVNGSIMYNMNPVIGTGSMTYTLDSFPLYPDKFPLKALGEYMYNPGAPNSNVGYRAGVVIGKAGKKKGWEVSYRYQRLESDAWLDSMVDDDNGAFYQLGHTSLTGTGQTSGWFGGTNVKGHLMQFTYSFTDFANFTFTYYLNNLIKDVPAHQSESSHFMADFMWKF